MLSWLGYSGGGGPKVLEEEATTKMKNSMDKNKNKNKRPRGRPPLGST